MPHPSVVPLHYQVKHASVRVRTKKLSKRNWSWVLIDFFESVIAGGRHCRTKAKAMAAGAVEKEKYIKSLVVYKVEIQLEK